MAGEIPPLIVEVQLQADQLRKELDKVKGELSTLSTKMKESNGAAEGMKGKFKELGKEIGKAFAAGEAIKFLVESGKAAIENQQSFALLSRQLKVTTGATAEQTKAIDDQLEGMSQNAGVLITKLRPAYSVFLRATGDSTKALGLQKLALDVAAGTGKDLATVSQAMARAVTGSSGALNRLVPGAKGASDQIAFLEKNFKGAAKAAADANPMQRLQVSFEKMKVTLGQALLPILGSLVKILNPLMPIFDLLAKVIAVVVKAVMPLIERIMKALMPALLSLAKALTPIIQSLLPPLIKLLDKVLVPVLMFVSTIISRYLVPYLTKLGQIFGVVLTGAVNIVVNSFQKMLKVLGPLWQFLKPILDAMMSMMGMKAEPVIKPTIDKSAVDNFNLAGIDLSSGGSTKSGGSGAAKGSDKTLVSALTKTQAEIVNAQKKYQTDVKAAMDSYASEVQKKIDDFKSAFAQATATNVGDMFSQGYQSADSLIGALTDKLQKIKKFSSDAAALAGQGYSAEFIKQVIAQGPVIGDQMAQSLLTAAPDAQKQIQDLFAQTQDASATGVDSVATSLSSSFEVSTKAMTDALTKAAQTLTDTLAKLGSKVKTTLGDATSSQLSSNSSLIKATGTQLASAQISAGVAPSQVINVSTTANTNASPHMIADATVATIKFGIPIVANGAPVLNPGAPR